MNLMSLLEEMSARHGQRLAIHHVTLNKTTETSYMELFNRVESVKAVIQDEELDGKLLAVSSTVTVDTYSCLLGTLASNSTFLPLAADSPRQRLLELFKRLPISALVGEIHFLKRCASILELGDVGLHDIPQHTHKLLKLPPSQLPWSQFDSHQCTPDTAYVISTSGTTGNPTIVRVPHSCILPNIVDLREKFSVESTDVIFQASPLTFDPSIVEMFLAFSAGAMLLVVSEEMKSMPQKLVNVLMDNGTTILQATPSLVHMMGGTELAQTLLSDTTSLRLLVLGGEACPCISVLQSWQAKGNKTQLANIYGISEVSCWASLYMLNTKEDQPISLGSPLAGTLLEVRDDDGCVVTLGEGQLFVGGHQRVCLLNDETDVDEGQMMRPSGDIVHIKDGALYYLGRLDRQIKRHGKRMNLQELEEVVILTREVERVHSVFAGNSLLLFIQTNAPEGEFSALKFQILLTLKDHLDSHYIPSEILVQNSAFPITKHGKLDEKQLLASITKTPLNQENKIDMKEYLDKLVKHVLYGDVTHIDLDFSVSFMEQGGDSIKATQLLTQLSDHFHKDNILVLLDELVQCPLGHVLHRMEELLTFSNFSNDVLHSNDMSLPSYSKHSLDTAYLERNLLKSKDSRDKRSKERNSPGSKLSLDNSPNDVNVPDKDMMKLTSIHVIDKLDTATVCNTCNVLFTTGRAEEQCDRTQPNKRMKLQSDESFSPCVAARHIIQADNVKPPPLMSLQRTSRVLIHNDDICRKEPVLAPCDNVTSNIYSQSQATGHLAPGRLGLVRRWEVNTGKCVDASPLVVREGNEAVAFIGSHSHLFVAVKVKNGSVLWKQTLGGRIESSACLSSDGELVVVGCYDGHVYCLHRHTGVIVWTVATGSQIKSSPCLDVHSGLVLFGSHDNCFYALDVQRKCVAWRRELDSGSLFASASVSTEPHQIYCATLGGSIYALKPTDGSTLWHRVIAAPIFSSPRCFTNGVCFGDVKGVFHAFSHKGDMLWTFHCDGPVFSSPCVWSRSQSRSPSRSWICQHCSTTSDYSDKMDVICFGSHDKYLYCLHFCGTLLWKVKADSEVYSSPFIWDVPLPSNSKNGVDYLPGDSNMSVTHKRNTQKSPCKTVDEQFIACVAFCTTRGRLHLVKLSDGTCLVTLDCGGDIFSSPVCYDDNLVVGCRNDFVYGFQITTL